MPKVQCFKRTQQNSTTKNVQINNVKHPNENYQAYNEVGNYDLEPEDKSVNRN